MATCLVEYHQYKIVTDDGTYWCQMDQFMSRADADAVVSGALQACPTAKWAVGYLDDNNSPVVTGNDPELKEGVRKGLLSPPIQIC